MSYYRRDYCIENYEIKADYFMYEGEKFEVDYNMTFNANIGNEGTPFVVGNLVTRKTDHLKLKTFLVKEWLQS